MILYQYPGVRLCWKDGTSFEAIAVIKKDPAATLGERGLFLFIYHFVAVLVAANWFRLNSPCDSE